jgi:hypothetical protein
VRIATVYKRVPLQRAELFAMDTVRWLRISEALADLGYVVDMIVNARGGVFGPPRSNLRFVPHEAVRWSDYHVVKTLFHAGFQSLVEEEGAKHPFIISKLGSVVGSRDGMAGVHFHGAERQALHEIQQAIARHARYVTVLTEPSRALWQEEFLGGPPLLLVPTGVDRTIPSPSRNPYPPTTEKIVVYVGNIYAHTQRDVNLYWQHRLNGLGRLLRQRGLRLFFVGPGRTDQLDPAAVTDVGPVPHDTIWDFQYFADVGLVLAQGPVQHNESSKIYYYLRTGLPVVSERPIPNNYLIDESGCGLIAEYGDDRMLADMVEAAAWRDWDTQSAMQYILQRHTWDRRVAVYDEVLAAERDRGTGGERGALAP